MFCFWSLGTMQRFIPALSSWVPAAACVQMGRFSILRSLTCFWRGARFWFQTQPSLNDFICGCRLEIFIKLKFTVLFNWKIGGRCSPQLNPLTVQVFWSLVLCLLCTCWTTHAKNMQEKPRISICFFPEKSSCGLLKECAWTIGFWF